MNRTWTQIDCDILMPVHNRPADVQEAVDSVLSCTQGNRYRLILVDDASDHETARQLADLAERHPHVTLLRNAQRLGFAQSCIQGYQAGDAPFLVLLKSDVVVTPGWLDRLLAAADTDARILSATPLTNQASPLALPMLPGMNFLGMNARLSRRAPRYPETLADTPFCLLLRRGDTLEHGVLEEIVGHGDRMDSAARIPPTSQGHRRIVADDVYVYRREAPILRHTDPQHAVEPLVPVQSFWDPMPLAWQTGRAVLNAARHLQPLAATRAAIKGLMDLPRARQPFIDPSTLGKLTDPGRLRITYILHRLVVAGGVLSVIQLVNALIRSGVEARIVTLFEDPLIHDWTRLYTRPIVFRNERELQDAFPISDIVVATLWTTAPWAKAVLDSGRARVGVYFMQDYEPWFFPAEKTAARAKVRATFGLLENRIVKSDWLAGMLAAEGYATRKILLGMDLGRFYPRDTETGPPTILAMARPRTPRRGFQATIEALGQVKAVRPEVRIRLFGDRALRRRAIPFDYEDEGVIADQDRMARVYSMADVFLDGSDFQGFGRCGLEAMACGAACVLTQVGGVNEYARHDGNALLVPPGEPEGFAAAILSLLDDPERRAKLVAAGRETAQGFCHRREARETLEYFHALTEGESST